MNIALMYNKYDSELWADIERDVYEAIESLEGDNKDEQGFSKGYIEITMKYVEE